jgi:protocatechuate 4,5-dioxygenase beta chain
VAKNGVASPTAGFFATIKAHLDEINPDLLILIQNDHFNTFFLDNWPTFALGVAERTGGPSDQTPEMPQYEVTIAQPLARHLLSSLVENDFDFSASQEFDIDHAVLVPLHFLTPTMAVPIVSVFINGTASAKRSPVLSPRFSTRPDFAMFSIDPESPP